MRFIYAIYWFFLFALCLFSLNWANDDTIIPLVVCATLSLFVALFETIRNIFY